MKKIDWRKRLRRLEFNFRRHPITLVGDEGRPYRKALLILCGLLLVLLLALFSREEPQLMASPEVAGIQDRAVLRVGIRSDIPDLGGLEHRPWPRRWPKSFCPMRTPPPGFPWWRSIP